MANINEIDSTEINRSLGRVESSLLALRDQSITHQADDNRVFNEIKQILTTQNDRLVKIENSIDSVETTIEGHGTAILDSEKRLTNFESLKEVEIAKHDRDRMWIKWILYLITALFTDHFTGSKVSEFVGHLIK